jgi:Fe2+ transport system protein FeoA
MVNINQSILARIATRILIRDKKVDLSSVANLSELPPGTRAKVDSYSALMPVDRKAHLQAYGLVPGNMIRVVQHSPVTIVQVEHTELALENSLAQMIQVEG